MVVARNVTRGTLLAGSVEVADGLLAKFLGLMGRAGLPPGAALWLPDSNGIHMMFMRFPIDAVFLSGGNERRVLSVHRSLPAWTGIVPFVRGAKGVLELPAGTIDGSRTEVGDVIRLEDPGPPDGG